MNREVFIAHMGEYQEASEESRAVMDRADWQLPGLSFRSRKDYQRK